MTLIETHSLTAQAPEAFPAALPVAGVQSAGITHQVEPNSVITTMDVPATNGRFILIGNEGSRSEVALQIERGSGLITGLLNQPVSSAVTLEATPEGSPAA